jgi:hypothetical protein
VLCLATGYGIAGQWMGAAIAILMGPAWWLARKYPRSWLPLVCLLGSAGLAAVGRLIGSPPVLMIFACAGSLAVWDIVLLDSELGSPSSVQQTRQYENKHLQSLMLALGGGLLGALLGRLVNVQISFIVLLLFITFILFALDRVWGYIKQTAKT